MTSSNTTAGATPNTPSDATSADATSAGASDTVARLGPPAAGGGSCVSGRGPTTAPSLVRADRVARIGPSCGNYGAGTEDSSSARSSSPSEPCDNAAMCQAFRSKAAPWAFRAFSRPRSQTRSPSL